MTYIPPVSEDEAKPAFKKFQYFFCLYLIVLFTLVTLILLKESFFDNKVVWTIGSFLTLGSVIGARYFDIKKNANPNNRVWKLKSKWLTLEKFIGYSWIPGSVLLVITKWLEK